MTTRMLRLLEAFSVQEVRDVPRELRRAVEVLLNVPGRAKPRYVFNPQSTEDDDGDIYLKPSPGSGDTLQTLAEDGRWVRQDLGSTGGGISLPILESDVTGLAGDLAALVAADAAEATARAAADSSEATARAAADTSMAADITEIETDLGELVTADATEATARAAADAALQALVDEIEVDLGEIGPSSASETFDRITSDSALGALIAGEATARAIADTNEAFNRATAISAEAGARAALSTRIDLLPGNDQMILASQIFGG